MKPVVNKISYLNLKEDRNTITQRMKIRQTGFVMDAFMNLKARKQHPRLEKEI